MNFKPTREIPNIPIEIQKEALEKINILARDGACYSTGLIL